MKAFKKLGPRRIRKHTSILYQCTSYWYSQNVTTFMASQCTCCLLYREDQADEYTSLKKELEQTNKNCRILSFKLRKAERKTEQLEAEKLEVERKFKEAAGGHTGLEKMERIKKLEQELTVANEVSKVKYM